MNIISDLWNGRFGLAKTYWLWGCLSAIPWNIALLLSASVNSIAIIVLLSFIVYTVILHVGIWRAASRYQGAKIWAILAKISVIATPASIILGIVAATALPAYKNYESSNRIYSWYAQDSSESYGFGIKTWDEYQETTREYRRKIASGDVYVFDSLPFTYLQSGDKEWPKEDVLKIGFLWWYEGDYIYMVIDNSHTVIPIDKILLGANYGACGTSKQTHYPINLGVSIKPKHYAVFKLSNKTLLKFAYQSSGKLNDEEQKRWSSNRTDIKDCIDIKNAWFSDF